MKRFLIALLVLIGLGLAYGLTNFKFGNPPQMEGVPISVLNGASWRPIVSSDMIATITGSGLSTNSASSKPGETLTELGGVRILFGTEPARLFYVSPQQINLLTPAKLPVGDINVRLVQGDVTVGTTWVSIVHFSPGLLADEIGGKRWAHSYAVGKDQLFHPLFSNKEPQPFTTSDIENHSMLAVEATGLEDIEPGLVQATVGGLPSAVAFVKPQTDRQGVQLVGLSLPDGIASGGVLAVEVEVNGVHSNPAMIRIAPAATPQPSPTSSPLVEIPTVKAPTPESPVVKAPAMKHSIRKHSVKKQSRVSP